MKYESPSAQLMMASPLGTKLLEFLQTCGTVCPWAPDLVAVSSMSIYSPFELRKSESTAELVTSPLGHLV